MEKTSRFLEAAEDLINSEQETHELDMRLQEMYAKADTVLYHNNVHAADVT